MEMAKKDTKGLFRLLIGITYDKSDILCWRAIEVSGIIAGEIAKTNPDVIRSLWRRGFFGCCAMSQGTIFRAHLRCWEKLSETVLIPLLILRRLSHRSMMR